MLVIQLLTQRQDERLLVRVKNFTDKKVLGMLEYEIEDRLLELVGVWYFDLEMKEITQNP
jgi:hypothetical protein